MLMLDEIRAEFARHLSEDQTGRWRMDAALAHVATMAYEKGLADGKQESPADTCDETPEEKCS